MCAICAGVFLRTTVVVNLRYYCAPRALFYRGTWVTVDVAGHG
jgi:hypothetical protein